MDPPSLDPPSLKDQLSKHNRNGAAPGLDRTLLRLRRRGWIRNTDAALHLTPLGQHALNSARSDLDVLNGLLNWTEP